MKKDLRGTWHRSDGSFASSEEAESFLKGEGKVKGERKWEWGWLWLVLVALLGLALWGMYKWGGRNTATAMRPTPTAQAMEPVSTPATTEEQEIPDCENVGWAQETIGLAVVKLSTENCAFTWNSSPMATGPANCDEGWMCTLHQEGEENAQVFEGENDLRMRITRGTFRYKPGYPSYDAVHTACNLLAKEQENGRTQNPSFGVDPGNISCPTKTAMHIVDDGGGISSTLDNTDEESEVTITVEDQESIEIGQAEIVSACPIITDRELDALPDGGCKLAWEGSVYEIVVPAGWMAYYWNGTDAVWAQPGESISTGDATFYNKDS